MLHQHEVMSLWGKVAVIQPQLPGVSWVRWRDLSLLFQLWYLSWFLTPRGDVAVQRRVIAL